MESFEFKPPSDIEISEAQQKLGFTFPNDYIDFIKSGYDLGNAPMEALEINNAQSHLDIYSAIADAKKFYELPDELLPICEDNSDYYCLNKSGQVVFWSHNGLTDEMWQNTKEWHIQMIAEALE
ncbi:SMI1/KNR4 family protein [Shewanella electrodiphila]|uniref:SMI1/KNR4 family protein n=1 Tax=Shewanella electrodiphila TaxID=934143 RepID=A0ABT0KLF4_9GAMM|nr:SMI1/KNR4 family protein [Shewanella electrodiphila]MCL1044240.1 SMI1/KNR4 family protein [Shewanella electrodiphila]